MDTSLSYKRSTSFLVLPETSLLSRIFTWETFKAIYPILMLGDSAYNLVLLSYPTNTEFQKTSMIFPGIKLLFSIIVFYIWYIFFRKDTKKSNNQLEKAERWVLNTLYLIYIFADTRPDHDNYIVFLEERPGISLLWIGLENLCKFLMFDFCCASILVKVLYVLINAKMFLVIFQTDVYLIMNMRLLWTVFILFGVGSFTWRMNKKRSKENAEEGSLILKRVLSFLPEGVLLLDSQSRVRFSNNYLQSIFNAESLRNEGYLSDEFRSVKLTDPVLHPSTGAKVTSNTLFQDLNQSWGVGSGSDKDRLLSRVQQFDNLGSLLGFLVNDAEACKALEKYVLTFQAKHHRHVNSHSGMALEIKINLFHKNNDDNYFIILFRDTTERQRIISLENENDNYRNNLIASFSHELRTPLNGTLAFLEQAIESSGVSQEIRDKLLKPALISGKVLLSIVNDILDYSQIILNKLELKNRPQNLVKTIEQCAELFREKLQQKGLRLQLNVDQTIPNPIFADHQRVSQILVNLLSNAIRFTTRGFIEIRLVKTSENNVLLYVKDTGTGMDQIVQEKLRKNLGEGEIKEKVNHHSAGIGLGLFISNALAQLVCSQGKLGLEFSSKKDEGTQFHLEIENRKPRGSYVPALQAGAAEDDTEERCQLNKVLVSSYSLNFKHVNKARQRVKRTEAQTVLIVDDEVFNIMVIENFCKAWGILTERAFDGKEALEKVKYRIAQDQPAFKMIFMDVNMPRMDGYEATVALKGMMRKGEMEETVIAGVTAYVSQGMIDKCYQSGMTEVLNKPLSKEMVMGVLRRYHVIR